jgi:hypothetical protein
MSVSDTRLHKFIYGHKNEVGHVSSPKKLKDDSSQSLIVLTSNYPFDILDLRLLITPLISSNVSYPIYGVNCIHTA